MDDKLCIRIGRDIKKCLVEKLAVIMVKSLGNNDRVGGEMLTSKE